MDGIEDAQTDLGTLACTPDPQGDRNLVHDDLEGPKETGTMEEPQGGAEPPTTNDISPMDTVGLPNPEMKEDYEDPPGVSTSPQEHKSQPVLSPSASTTPENDGSMVQQSVPDDSMVHQPLHNGPCINQPVPDNSMVHESVADEPMVHQSTDESRVHQSIHDASIEHQSVPDGSILQQSVPESDGIDSGHRVDEGLVDSQHNLGGTEDLVNKDNTDAPELPPLESLNTEYNVNSELKNQNGESPAVDHSFGEEHVSLEEPSSHKSQSSNSEPNNVEDGLEHRIPVDPFYQERHSLVGDVDRPPPDHLRQFPEEHQQYAARFQQFLNQHPQYEDPDGIKEERHAHEHYRNQESCVPDFENHQMNRGLLHSQDQYQQNHFDDQMSNERLPPQHGYWDMHRDIFSKVKSEAKEWFERDVLGGPDGHSPSLMKPGMESNDVYRMSHPSSMGSDSPISGPRPSPLPHGAQSFPQSPEMRPQMPQMNQHFMQPFPNHPGLRDLSPGFQGHPRGLLQHSHPVSGAQDHPGLQHLQHHYGVSQQQHQMNHLQQLPSPYNQGMLGSGMGGPGNHRGHEPREGDPYSFVDEYTGPPPRPVEEILGGTQPKRRGRKPKHIKLLENGGDPLAIAAAQAAHEAKKRKWKQMGPDGKPICFPGKPRKRMEGFDGMTQDDFPHKILPDHIAPNLDIVIIGINPGMFAAYKGHHYAGPGNHFWKCLYLSGLIPEPLTSDEDRQLMDYGIGFTNIVSRTARGPSELTRKEIKEGGQMLLAKLQRFQPRIAVFNGKGIYEVFSGKKEFTFGRQPERIEGTRTHVWVMPSASARCAQLPRALDKVPFYTALRKFRDFLKGTIPEITEEEVDLTTSKVCAKHILKDCDKLGDLHLDDDPVDLFMDDSDSFRFESEMDSEEISRCISQSLYNLSGMTMEQLEALECPTIPIRKKRGRPKKTAEDPNAPMKSKAPSAYPTEYLMYNEEEPPRKKRGRPKKVLEDGSIAPPKRANRKPKALKEMLAGPPVGHHHVHPNQHSQMGHFNGMLSPTGYNSGPGMPPFPPQFGGHPVHHMNSPHSGEMMHSHLGVGDGIPHRPNHPNFSGSHNPMHPGHGHMSVNPLHQHGCPTPTSTPQGYAHSPVYSPGPVHNQMHRMPPGFQSLPDKAELLEDERQLGLSPLPCSPAMTQQDFEAPASLSESDTIMSESRSGAMTHQEDTALPSIQSQFSDSSTVPEDASTPFSNFPSYPTTTSCPTNTYASNASPSYPPSVSCSPSYTPLHNTQSPSYPPNSVQSPSYQHTMTQSPSCQAKPAPSPSYPNAANHSPSFPAVSQSSTFPTNSTQSPSYSTLTQSPSYPTNVAQSPSYRPSTSQSPSFHSPGPTQSPFAPSMGHSPLNKLDQGSQGKTDVSSKSLSGLESLVDQIPSINDAEGGLPNGPSSNPTTPAAPTNDPFSPGQTHKNPAPAFSNFSGASGGQAFNPRYESPQGPNFSPQNNPAPSNFSVTSLATSSCSTPQSTSIPYEGADCSPHSASSNGNVNPSPRVSASVPPISRATATPTPTNTLYANSFSPSSAGPSPHSYEMMNSSGLPPTPPMGPNYMGSGMSGSAGSPMNMGSQLPYPYNQYSESPPNCYPGPGHPPFPYSSSPGIPVPSHRYGYPSPYSNGPYGQGYPQNAMLDRIKQAGMGMGYGGY